MGSLMKSFQPEWGYLRSTRTIPIVLVATVVGARLAAVWFYRW